MANDQLITEWKKSNKDNFIIPTEFSSNKWDNLLEESKYFLSKIENSILNNEIENFEKHQSYLIEQLFYLEIIPFINNK